jgi:hypothetical protein
MTVGFAALSLGPFFHIGGMNTYVPGPWALLRYVPVLNTARAPTRFSIMAALGLAMLFAGGLSALRTRFPQQRRAMMTAVAVLLLFELLPSPRPLFDATVPAFYSVIAADPRPVRVLNLPFGVRDGTSAVGDFSARYLFHQTAHGKRLVGGYLSRMPRKRVRQMRAQPTLDALIDLSEGRRLTPARAAWLRSRGARFVARINVGYVVVDERRTPQDLVEFATDAWKLREIAREGPLVLYVPSVPSSLPRAVRHGGQ